MWLTVGVSLLANRCSFMAPWQHSTRWGESFLEATIQLVQDPYLQYLCKGVGTISVHIVCWD